MSAEANPYKEALTRLEAVPEGKRYLLSQKRRGPIAGVRGTCGCLFGTIAPPRVRNPESCLTYGTDAYRNGVFGQWAEKIFGADSPQVVQELERTNDLYMPKRNDRVAAAERYQHMINHLRARVTQWEQDMKSPKGEDDV